jgi:hypothetical protein
MQNWKLILTLLFAMNFLSNPARAASADSAGKVIWDHWYTVTVRNIPYEYYSEKVVLKDGNIHFFNDVWKKEEGFLNQEQLGAFSNSDVDLTPLFYNYRATYRSNEVTIDGNVHDGKTLVVKVKKGGEALPTITKSISPKTFLSLFFPLWLGKQLQTAKENVTISFSTILEDNVDDGFDSTSGRVRLEKADEFAKSSKTKKVAVDYKDDSRSYWWVDDLGSAVKIEMPDKGTVVLRTTKEKAEAFLPK